MTRPTRPEVTNPELRTTLERVGEHIENYTANLDGMSKDIKLIEQYLVDSGIRLEASVCISSIYHADPGPWRRVEETLKWAPESPFPFDDANERWRIVYCRTSQVGQLEDGEFYPRAESEIEEQKALIETPIATRLKTHSFLPKLLNQIASTVKITPVHEDDIPF